MRITALTDRGHEREHNEDCVGWNGWSMTGGRANPLVFEFDVVQPTVVVVCDGMGGHAGGSTASRIAAEMLSTPEWFVSTGIAHGQLTERIQHVSDRLNDLSGARSELTGMGCTAVGAVVHPAGSALVFNVGDSRCYRIEGRYLAQLTVDHRRSGTNVLTQALGGGRRLIVEPDFFECAVPEAPGLLLSTDGLDDYATQDAIEELAIENRPDLAVRLRDLALAGGGGDNVTIVQLEYIRPVGAVAIEEHHG